jgi:hypothetical protein
MYYHGGTPDLHIGDTIQPGQEGNRRHVEGCPICAARNTGNSPDADPIEEPSTSSNPLESSSPPPRTGFPPTSAKRHASPASTNDRCSSQTLSAGDS